MRNRAGLTLIEIVIAIVIFAIGGLGLAATSAGIARQISTNTLRSRAANLARSRAETIQGSQCGSIASGESRNNGIYATWSIGGTTTLTLDQRLERTDSRGTHGDRFLSAVRCD